MANQNSCPSRNYPYITDITADGLLEHVAIVIEGTFGRAHTYASENADVYRAQDNAIATAAKRVRALKGAYKLAPLSEIASPDALYTALARKVTASQWQNEHYNQGLWDMKEALKGKEK